MPPGTAARGAPAAARRPWRIPFGRARVVALVVPVGAPFMNVVAQIVEPIGVRRIQAHRFRPVLPPLVVIGKCPRRRISPWIRQTLRAAARRAFPFCFNGQAIKFARRVAQPIAIRHCLMPRHRHHRHPRMIEVCVRPARRLWMPRRGKKAAVLLVRRLVRRQLKRIHPNPVHRFLIITPAFASHPEPPLRDAHHLRLNDSRLRSTRSCFAQPRPSHYSPPSFRTKQVVFFFPLRSREAVGPRSETSAPSLAVYASDEISLCSLTCSSSSVPAARGAA